MLKKFISSAIILCGLFLQQAQAARPMIIDTDMGIDDALATFYLLNRSDLDIKAITIAVTGETHCQAGLKNTAGLIKAANKSNIPEACGREKGLGYSHEFPAWVRKISDELMGTAKFLPHATPLLAKGSAKDLLMTTLENSKEPVDIVALGPLTNIAELVVANPQIKNKIHQVYIMGGAVHVPGNLTGCDPNLKNKLAEWNIYADPKAANIVFQSGLPLTLISLDTTNQAPVNEKFYQHLTHHPVNNNAQQFMHELFMRNKHTFLQYKWYFWDPLAAVVASDESIATMKNEKLRVALSPELKSGATLVDEKNGNVVRVCRKINEKKFEDRLLNM